MFAQHVPSPFSLSLSYFQFFTAAAKRRMAGSNFPRNCAMPEPATLLHSSLLRPSERTPFHLLPFLPGSRAKIEAQGYSSACKPFFVDTNL